MSDLTDFLKGLTTGASGAELGAMATQRYDARMGRERIAEADKQAAIAKAEHEAELKESEKAQKLEQQEMADFMSNLMLGEEFQQPQGGFFPGATEPTGYEQPLGEVNPALMGLLQGGDYNAIMNAMTGMGQIGVPLYEPPEEEIPDEFNWEQLMGAMGLQHQGAPMLQIAESQPELGLGAEAEWVRENAEIANQLFEAMAPQPEGIAPFTLGDTQVRYLPTEEGGLTPVYNPQYGQEDTGRTGMRTDRHNNPTAMITDFAGMLGGQEGVDYVRGDSFRGEDGGTYYTARLLGDGIETSIRMFDRGAQSGSIPSGVFSWWDGISDQQWLAKTEQEKISYLNSIYQMEGGAYTASGFRGVGVEEAEPKELGGYETWSDVDRQKWWELAGGSVDVDTGNYVKNPSMTFADTQNRAEYLREQEEGAQVAPEPAPVNMVEIAINDAIRQIRDEGADYITLIEGFEADMNEGIITPEIYSAIAMAIAEYTQGVG